MLISKLINLYIFIRIFVMEVNSKDDKSQEVLPGAMAGEAATQNQVNNNEGKSENGNKDNSNPVRNWFYNQLEAQKESKAALVEFPAGHPQKQSGLRVFGLLFSF
jgi:hypothetical protein